MTESVSVIVPIYNRQNRMDECINSICEQSYKNLEILLVDDGSTDESLKRMQEWAQKDPRVRALTRANGGPSAARNMGLSEAKGKWILFVDSDDHIPPRYVENMLELVSREGVDSIPVSCVAARDSEEGVENKAEKNAENRFDKANQNILYFDTCHFMELEQRGLLTPIWNKLYSRELLDRYKIRFDEGRRSGEDFLFNLSYLSLSELSKFAILPKNQYYYTQENQDRLSVLEDTRLELFEESQILLREKMEEMKSSSGDFRLWKCREDRYQMLLLAATLQRRDLSFFRKLSMNQKAIRGQEFQDLLSRNDLGLGGMYFRLLRSGCYPLVWLYEKLSGLRRGK